MNVSQIRMQGFRSYADATVRIPKGTVGVVGENGAGKSSLMEAICFGLFGPEGRSVTPYVTEGEDKLLVELLVEHGVDVFRVRRSANGSRTALDFDRLGDDGSGDVWSPLSQGSQKDTQAVIERTLGVNRTTFLHSVFLRQGAGGSFPQADPRDRRELLANALGLDVYDRAHALVTTDRRAADRALAELLGRALVLEEGLEELDGLRAQIDAMRLSVEGFDQITRFGEYAVTVADAEARRLAEEGAAWREQAFVVKAADDIVDRARQQQEASEGARLAAMAEADFIANLEVALAELEDVRERLLGAQAQQRLYDEANLRRNELLSVARTAEAQADEKMQQAAPLEERIAQVKDGALETCDRCQQHVGGDARDAMIESLRQEWDVLAEQARILRTRAEVNQEAADAVNMPSVPDMATVNELKQRNDELSEVPAALAVRRERLAAAERQAAAGVNPDTLAEWERDAVEAHRALAAIPAPDEAARSAALEAAVQARQDLDVARRNAATERAALERVTGRVEELERRSTQLAGVIVERDRAEAELEELNVLDRAFGPAGVPAWIVEHNAIPAIEQHANEVLARLGGAVRRVELRTERESKDGTVKAALDVVCHTDGGARDFQTFSGGEQTRADLALRLGLSRLLAGRRSDVRLLCLDEPAGLDAAGMEALVGVLRDLTLDGRVETVLLASHVPALRDAFDTALVVERVGGRSEVTVS